MLWGKCRESTIRKATRIGNEASIKKEEEKLSTAESLRIGALCLSLRKGPARTACKQSRHRILGE